MSQYTPLAKVTGFLGGEEVDIYLEICADSNGSAVVLNEDTSTVLFSIYVGQGNSSCPFERSYEETTASTTEQIVGELAADAFSNAIMDEAGTPAGFACNISLLVVAVCMASLSVGYIVFDKLRNLEALKNIKKMSSETEDKVVEA